MAARVLVLGLLTVGLLLLADPGWALEPCPADAPADSGRRRAGEGVREYVPTPCYPAALETGTWPALETLEIWHRFAHRAIGYLEPARFPALRELAADGLPTPHPDR